MSVRADNAATEKAMRDRAAERRAQRACSTCDRPAVMPMPLTCRCGFSTLCSRCANTHQCPRTAKEAQP